MKAKINVKKLLENYYFKFDDYSNLIFTVDDKITTAEELKQGVDVEKEL